MTTYFVDVLEADPLVGEYPVSVEMLDGSPDMVVEILSPGPQGIPGPAVTTDPDTGANFAVLANGGKYIYAQPTQPVMDVGDIWFPVTL
jgi:hypothetical protein